MKKNLTKKLMLSVLTLAFAVVSLGASTFAWFTVSKEADVEKFEMDVTADAGIQVAVGTVYQADVKDTSDNVLQEAYKSAYAINHLPKTEIQNALDAMRFDKFMDVTAYKAGADFNGSFYDTDGSAIAVKAVGEKIGYVALRFYVKADQDGQLTVNVPWLTNETPTANIVSWNAGVTFSRTDETKDDLNDDYDADASFKYDVLSAARLAIQFNDPETDSTSPKPEEAIKRFEAAVSPAADGSYGNTSGYNAAGALEIYNKINKNNTGWTDLQAPTEDEDVETYDATKAGYVLNIKRNVEYSFDVYIWIEGFDGECTNAIFAQKLSYLLEFNFA